MQIRIEEPRDEAAVREVHRAAFGEEGDLVVRLLGSLREHLARYDGLSLVALEGEDVVGHVMFTRAVLDAPERLVDVQVLSPIGVVPDRQGQGLGTALIRRGIELLGERAVPLVFLEGSPRYYPRHGFVPGATLGFRKPSLRIPDEAFQVLALPAYEPWMTGTLVYPQLFWDHDAVGLRDGEE